MKLLILQTTNPYLNLAIEEYIFEKMQDDVFILWQNEPTVVIGKNQNANTELDLDYIKKNNIHVARRITGGGAVYHDLGNLNYSFIANKDGESIDFASYTAPIIQALASLGVNAELSGRNDITVNGKKISGNAQYSSLGRVLHHGTLLFSSDLEVLTSALKVDEEKIKAKAIKSVRSRVTNIIDLLDKKMDVFEFTSLLASFIKKRFSAEIINCPEDDMINTLEKRNMSEDWLYPDRDYLASYEIHKKRRFNFGTVEICLKMSNNIIKDAKIYGDFFELMPIIGLEEKLKDQKLSEIKNYYDLCPEKFISGITKGDFVDLLLN